MATIAACYAAIYVQSRLMGPFGQKEQLDNTRKESYA
jgi:hypothetical protein